MRTEQLALDNYDPSKDSHDSYFEAIAELRRRKLLAGEAEPVNEQEREFLKQHGRAA